MATDGNLFSSTCWRELSHTSRRRWRSSGGKLFDRDAHHLLDELTPTVAARRERCLCSGARCRARPRSGEDELRLLVCATASAGPRVSPAPCARSGTPLSCSGSRTCASLCAGFARQIGRIARGQKQGTASLEFHLLDARVFTKSSVAAMSA